VRLALLSDVHGNPLALEAVLADIEASGGVDAYWVLGDLAAIGYAPVRTLERLSRLPGLRAVRGNTDRYVTSGALPPPSVEDARRDPALLPRLVEVAQSFAWTQGALAHTGWLEWLAGLPVEERTVLPDGTRLLGVHASPGRDDGSGIHPGLSDARVSELLAECDAELVCTGHTHWAMDRRYGAVRVVNVSSVSNPHANDVRASYAVIDAERGGYTVTLRRVAYDCAAVIAEIERSGHPAGEFIAAHFRAERHPPWATP
jgi:predicted phosphodiesterase